MGDTMQQRLTQDLTQFLASLPEDDRIKAINEIRMAIHQVSPFREEPVDCVLWVNTSHCMHDFLHFLSRCSCFVCL